MNIDEFHRYISEKNYRGAYELFEQYREALFSELSPEAVIGAFIDFHNAGMQQEAEDFYGVARRVLELEDKEKLELGRFLISSRDFEEESG